METYRIRIMPQAATDLQEIHDYIAKDSPSNATEMAGRILEGIDGLRDAPHRTIVERKGRNLRYPTRSLSVYPYVIYFRVIEPDQMVRITHIRHGARRPPTNFG
jgi:plasmid stabilization system protein ParE